MVGEEEQPLFSFFIFNSTKTTTMKTRLVKNTWVPMGFNAGWGNGYVIVPKEHPLHGVHYNALYHVEVHGGLTFSEEITADNIEHFDLTPEDIGSWCFGFDTAHCGDSLDNWSKEDVQRETDDLLQNLSVCVINPDDSDAQEFDDNIGGNADNITGYLFNEERGDC
jgi:hypothetical protein